MSFVLMKWHINNLNLGFIQSGHNYASLTNGSLLTRPECLRCVTHSITSVTVKAKLIALHNVVCKLNRILLAALHTLLAAPQYITQLIVAKFKPLRQPQRA